MATTKIVAGSIKALKYSDLIDLANDLVQMQQAAKEDGWEWLTSEVHGEYGLAQMLYSWAEAQD
jgi:hypothetical protein